MFDLAVLDGDAREMRNAPDSGRVDGHEDFSERRSLLRYSRPRFGK
jgi:hypothetical protein